MKLGEKIKQIRDDNGWSQDSICDLAKISQSTLSGIEHDRHIMLEELKKYFKPKFYNKVCEFRWEEIRRLFGILKGR